MPALTAEQKKILTDLLDNLTEDIKHERYEAAIQKFEVLVHGNIKAGYDDDQKAMLAEVLSIARAAQNHMIMSALIAGAHLVNNRRDANDPKRAQLGFLLQCGDAIWGGKGVGPFKKYYGPEVLHKALVGYFKIDQDQEATSKAKVEAKRM